MIVLEADLRRPMLHEYLGLDNRVGVSNVLVGASNFADSIQVVRVPTSSRLPRKGSQLLSERRPCGTRSFA